MPNKSSISKASTNTPAFTPILYNIPTWCRVMGFGRSKTYQMLANGELKAVKVAGRTLIPATEALRLIEEAA